MIDYHTLPNSIKKEISQLSKEETPIPIIEDNEIKAYIIDVHKYNHLVSLAEQYKEQLSQIEESYLNFLIIVASALDTHEAYLAGHTDRVTMLASALAEHLNLEDDFVQDLRLASLLHDIGEVAIPNDILNKVGKLSSEELMVLRKHPIIGSQIVSTVSRLERVAEIIHAHHEKYDGSGYPLGRKGEEIPFGARILAIVDAYDAMTNLRTNRENIDHDQAMEQLKAKSGKDYDPKILQEFERIF